MDRDQFCSSGLVQPVEAAHHIMYGVPGEQVKLKWCQKKVPFLDDFITESAHTEHKS